MNILVVGDFESLELSVAACIEQLRLRYPAAALAFAGPVSRYLRNSFKTIPVHSSVEGEEVEKVVVCGPFSSLRVWRDALARAHAIDGVPIELHNLSLPFHKDFMTWPEEYVGMTRITSISVRDHRTAETMQRWPLKIFPRVLRYPSAEIEADHSLAGQLGEGAYLGVSMRSTESMKRLLDRNGEILADILAPFKASRILPLPANVSAATGPNDVAGIRTFVEQFFPDSEIVMPELLEATWLENHLTASRLKGLCAACRVIVTQRELPVAFASVYAGRVVAIGGEGETQAFRALATLASQLHPMSRAIRLG